MSSVPDLGVGLGLRVPHLRTILRDTPAVDFFELISENFMVDGGPPLRNLDAVTERYPVVLHGVSMGLGSAEPLDREHLEALVRLQRRTGAAWVSEHLCWTRSGDAHLHDLLPLPYTAAVAAFVADKAAHVQDRLGVPFAIENLSSYVAFRQSLVPEWEFYREVVERAGCFMMLDVNNVYVSSVNHGFDPWQYLAAMPWERVIQVHVAGHTRRPDGTLLDTHDHPVCDEVWALYAEACRRTGGVSTLLEWDAKLPSFAETLAEAEKARSYRDHVLGQRPTPEGRGVPEPEPPEGHAAMLGAFARCITTPLELVDGGHRLQTELFEPAVVESMLPGPVLGPLERLAVYNQQYWFRLLTVAQEELPLLRHLMGVRELNRLVMAYIEARPSQHPGLHRLLEELPAHMAEQPELLQQALAVDLAWQRVFFAAQHQVLDTRALDAPALAILSSGPLPLQPALALVAEDWKLMALRRTAAADPDDEVVLPEPERESAWWALYRSGRTFMVEPLSAVQHRLLGLLMSGQSLPQALGTLQPELDAHGLAELTGGIQAWFRRWAGLGWFATP